MINMRLLVQASCNSNPSMEFLYFMPSGIEFSSLDDWYKKTGLRACSTEMWSDQVVSITCIVSMSIRMSLKSGRGIMNVWGIEISIYVGTKIEIYEQHLVSASDSV